MISRRYQPASASNSIPLAREDSSSSSEDEEEEERLVSQEQPTTQTNSKKRQTDADIANDLNTGTVKPKKPRMVLTSAKLTGPDGFLKIRHNFPSQVKYRPPKSLKKDSKRKFFERDIHASAVYIGKLMQAYQQFAIDIAPNMHYNDAFIKIRDLGSKKDVKDHVNMMRQEVCKAHLEKVYGREKAERFVDELEHGFRTGEKETVDEFELMERDTGRGVAQRLANLVGENDDEEEVNNDGSEKESEKQDNSLNASATTTGNEKAGNSTMQDSDDDEEMEANFDDVSPTPANDASNDHATTTDGNVSNEEESKDSPKDSDDEEEEATFDDLAVPSEKPVQAEQENTDAADKNNDNISEEATPQVVLEEVASETEEKEKEANEATTNNELEQSQDSFSMSQESMVFDATQDTMIMDSTQADLATQDTLVEDVSQTQPTQLLEDLGNSQDY
ncbi:hypothetical protein CTEN210_01123 [Chaetoceros tenuissimus]|uniref:Chromosome segregation in meiosis protein 3 domain-containing protein n=1 Tax=Chaetoceros tenuissimus TaxID=426638 RepID=A0AAD3CFE9_9STRA|nr:hypothetical protein CTEN210_01123 [Chaetoceros tenuissimus]